MPSHEPDDRSAAFTPLRRPKLLEHWKLKRRERRAPVQGFNARIFSGISLPIQAKCKVSRQHLAKSHASPAQSAKTAKKSGAWRFYQLARQRLKQCVKNAVAMRTAKK